MKKTLPALFALLAAAPALADGAAFAAPFTSHAVLQRDCPLPVWGTAEPGAAVSVALDGVTATAKADEKGAWRVTFPPQTKPGAGHTLSLTVDGEKAATLDDIAIGDVWICSGQSNMDMNYGWGLTRGKEDIESVNDPLMRLFDDHNAVSGIPLATLTEKTAWTPSDFTNARTFSACGWFFGQALRKALPEVPVGLIEASWSGSPIKTWISAESYQAADPVLAEEYAAVKRNMDDYEARGGKPEYERRLALWKAESAAKGDIKAEGADYDDSTWKEVSLPVTFEKQFDADYDGCVWYRRFFDLDAGQAAGEATLTLGAIDDKDWTWVNGHFVGSNTLYNAARKYKVPAGILREGRNVVAVKTIDIGGAGGFTGTADKLALATAAGTVPLAGAWRSIGFRYDPKPKDGGISAWSPTACYNAMIHPLFPMAAKGAIWYQGCSDVGRGGALYEKQFRALAADWRAGFTHPDGFPIYIVQLAAFKQTHKEPFESAWAAMRWSQMKLGETLEKCGTAVAIDIGHHTDIHPKDKKTVGERLARLALVRTYGVKDLVEAGPIPVGTPERKVYGNGVDPKDGKQHHECSLFIDFKNADDGLGTSDDDFIRGFEAKIGDVWTKVKASNAGHLRQGKELPRIELMLPRDTAPESVTAVRYAWDDYPDCNLVNGAGLPCGPFELEVKAK